MKTYVINLKRRTDRLESIQKQFANIPYEIWEATDGNSCSVPRNFIAGSGAWGCRDSHIRLLKHCLENGIDKVLVFEDDVVLKPKFLENFQKYINILPNNTDAFFLGGQHIQAPEYTNIHNLLKCRNTHRTHAYMICNTNYMRKLLNAWEMNYTHIDHVFGNTQIGYNVFCPKEWLCSQSESYSDIINRHLKLREWRNTRIQQPATVNNNSTFSHAGDLGDLLAQLPVIKTFTNQPIDLVLNHSVNLVRDPFHKEKVDRLQSLLEMQSYIKSVTYSDIPLGFDCNIWRKRANWRNGNLTTIFAKAFKIQFTIPDSWITCNPRFVSPIVIQRSERYGGDNFPWKEVVDRYGSHITFVGTEREHEVFCNLFGTVPYYKTNTLLDLAETIKGSKLFIGNQSSPYWLSVAMGCATWLEVSKRHNNSQIVRGNVHCSNAIPEQFLQNL